MFVGFGRWLPAHAHRRDAGWRQGRSYYIIVRVTLDDSGSRDADLTALRPLKVTLVWGAVDTLHTLTEVHILS